MNQLEAFTYKVRDLVDSEAFISASTEAERQTLSEKASEASDWLYEEGDSATKDDFVAKLKALQDLVAPIQKRLDEAEKRPGLITDLRNILNTTNVFIDTVRGQIAAYDEWKSTASAKSAESATSSAAAETTSNDFEGLEDEDDTPREAEEKPVPEEVVPPLHNSEEIDTLEVLYKETLEWLNKLERQQADIPLTEEPVLVVSELVARRDALDRASLDLALKSYTQYQKNNKPKKPTKSKKAKKQDKTKSADKAGPTFEFPEGSVPLSGEELEELVKKYMKEEEDSRRQAEEKPAEEKQAEDAAKPSHDEL